jgi:hypothetical protein
MGISWQPLILFYNRSVFILCSIYFKFLFFRLCIYSVRIKLISFFYQLLRTVDLSNFTLLQYLNRYAVKSLEYLSPSLLVSHSPRPQVSPSIFHSSRSASIGLIWSALFAGIDPAKSPARINMIREATATPMLTSGCLKNALSLLAG